MKDLITNFWNKSIVRYVFFGSLSYVIEVGTIQASLFIFHDSVFSVTVGFWFGLAVAFFLQKVFAFQDAQKSPKRLPIQILAYGLLITVNYLFTIGIVLVFGNTVIGILGARTIALLITTIWNFFAYKYIIFKHNNRFC